MSKECPDPRRTQFLDIFLPCFAYWSLLLSWNSVQRMPVTSLSPYKTDVRGQSRHTNIWHIHNFSVAPVTDPPGWVPGRKCLCSLGSTHSTMRSGEPPPQAVTGEQLFVFVHVPFPCLKNSKTQKPNTTEGCNFLLTVGRFLPPAYSWASFLTLCPSESPNRGRAKTVEKCQRLFWHFLTTFALESVSKAVKVCLAAPTVRTKETPHRKDNEAQKSYKQSFSKWALKESDIADLTLRPGCRETATCDLSAPQGKGPGSSPSTTHSQHPDFPRQSPPSPPAVSAAVLGSRASGVPLAGRPGLCRQPWAGKAKRTLQKYPRKYTPNPLPKPKKHKNKWKHPIFV